MIKNASKQQRQQFPILHRKKLVMSEVSWKWKRRTCHSQFSPSNTDVFWHWASHESGWLQDVYACLHLKLFHFRNLLRLLHGKTPGNSAVSVSVFQNCIHRFISVREKQIHQSHSVAVHGFQLGQNTNKKHAGLHRTPATSNLGTSHNGDVSRLELPVSCSAKKLGDARRKLHTRPRRPRPKLRLRLNSVSNTVEGCDG